MNCTIIITVFKSSNKWYSIFTSNNFNDVKTNIINDYINSRLNIVKNATINKKIKSLETTINFLIKNDYLEKINFKFKKLPTTKTKIESINKEDIQKIINYLKTNCSITSQLIFMLMLTTGIRTNELCHIETNNISITKKSIQLTFTKNKQPRMIYLLDEIVELIKKIYILTINICFKIQIKNVLHKIK